jgi:hypothetical protein
MKRIVSLVLAAALLGLSFGCTPYHAQGAGTGAVVGGVAGAFLDSRNPWRGGVIGGVLGAIVGATLADISYRASRDAVREDRPVEYRTEDGRGVYRATPEGYDERTRCHKVREKVWEDGRLVKDHIKEVCEGQKYERRY